MPIFSPATSFFFHRKCQIGQGRRQSSVEWGEIPSVRLYVRQSAHPSAPPLAGPQTLPAGPQTLLAGPQAPPASPQTGPASHQTPLAGPQTPPAGPQDLQDSCRGLKVSQLGSEALSHIWVNTPNFGGSDIDFWKWLAYEVSIDMGNPSDQDLNNYIIMKLSWSPQRRFKVEGDDNLFSLRGCFFIEKRKLKIIITCSKMRL